MKTNTSLPTAILTFATTGVFGPHKSEAYEAPRNVSSAPRTFFKPKPTAN